MSQPTPPTVSNPLTQTKELLANAEEYEEKLANLSTDRFDWDEIDTAIPHALRRTAERIRDRYMRDLGVELFEVAKARHDIEGGDAGELTIAIGREWLAEGRILDSQDLIELVYRAANTGWRY